MRILVPLTLALLAAPAAGAQSLPDMDAALGAVTEAAGALREAGEDRLLIADALGREVFGADGEAVGTVEDFAVLPGGNLVAAIVARPDGGRIALPWKAVQAGLAAGRTVELPMTGAEIDGAEALRELSDALGL
jgi:hypothetical protein